MCFQHSVCLSYMYIHIHVCSLKVLDIPSLQFVVFLVPVLGLLSSHFLLVQSVEVRWLWDGGILFGSHCVHLSPSLSLLPTGSSCSARSADRRRCFCIHVYMYVWVFRCIYIVVAVPRKGSMSPATASAILAGHSNYFFDITKQQYCINNVLFGYCN